MKSTLLTAIILAGLSLSPTATAQGSDINYGADDGNYANDGECDDPRFIGPGTTADVDWTSAGRDATDCRQAVKHNTARYRFDPLNLILTDCDSVEFGHDSSDYANDLTCDDPRFLSFTAPGITVPQNVGKDATDCKQACSLSLLYQKPLN